ncbi:HigA family addiction module antitoxin [Ancylobacter sp. SL191]|uniref:HigA family addiction module antitoxin n=1 Tax=Ancylobacter sp. SL191 TaxID=2995166 RepID=UPI00226FE561|nr:HigA family addiction module antitoxin [Ancylobacter sp. SL191]WAC28551.1 HigA family addiction module antitoxin [Ancylobacter sp. SL191]
MAVTFARPLHPGEFLREEYLVPLGMSAGQLARALGLPRTRIERIVREEIGISTDTALRLARFFRTSPGFWLNLQQSYEVETQTPQLAAALARITPLRSPSDSTAA